jgi:hypothetical protein
VLTCPKCQGQLRVLAVVTELDSARRVHAHLGMPIDPPPPARAREPTADPDDAKVDGQLEFRLA